MIFCWAASRSKPLRNKTHGFSLRRGFGELSRVFYLQRRSVVVRLSSRGEQEATEAGSMTRKKIAVVSVNWFFGIGVVE